MNWHERRRASESLVTDFQSQKALAVFSRYLRGCCHWFVKPIVPVIGGIGIPPTFAAPKQERQQQSASHYCEARPPAPLRSGSNPRFQNALPNGRPNHTQKQRHQEQSKHH